MCTECGKFYFEFFRGAVFRGNFPRINKNLTVEWISYKTVFLLIVFILFFESRKDQIKSNKTALWL